jgi:dihydrofolate reductase
MSRLFLQINVSVDGLIEDGSGKIDFHADEEFNEFIDQTLLSIDAMIFGRVAFEQLAQYWPTASPEETSEVQVRRMHELPKYVVSNRLTQTNWNNSHIIRGDVATTVKELKHGSHRDIALFAGGDIATSFIQQRLVDEYRLIIQPALLGAGKPLFRGGYERLELRLTGVERFESGALVLFYQPT